MAVAEEVVAVVSAVEEEAAVVDLAVEEEVVVVVLAVEEGVAVEDLVAAEDGEEVSKQHRILNRTKFFNMTAIRHNKSVEHRHLYTYTICCSYVK